MKQTIHLTYFLILSILLGSCTMSQKNRQYAEGVSELQGSYWMLLSLQGQELQDNPESNTAYLRFEEGSDELKGFTGCNRLMGRYSLSNDNLQLTNLGSTRAMCPIIEQENYLMAILQKVDAFKISGDVLTLFHKNTAVATFRAGAPPMSPDGL
ncbi:META domain-containing protein [Pontibacter sp. JH31]|uniref:META domain-containing protein n=1 Tax=Pontibacter aquaedesilientis TaxID=2766980 RepID=A0ABR7XHL2_9BACT|nr:META domain-containing protein [Pontibacter aquaedesilientis]MBD1397123.1 META domain-containing protein [Pontibacter aquaedesilientis]